MGGFIPSSPIDPSFQPTTSITKLPITTDIETIISTLDRDGGLILTDLLSPSEIAQIASDTLPYAGHNATPHSGIAIVPQETQLIGGLIAKSPTMLALCEHPILVALRSRILTDEGSIPSEEIRKNWHIDPLLSLSVSFQIRHGAPRQRLHRDDGIHLIDHSLPYKLEKVSQFACLMAGVETTRENGATMFVPGSHRWDEKRQPRLDEITFAEMSPGSALIFLAGSYHGGGHNSVPNSTRIVHGLFFCRGTLRTEENQFLAVPRSMVPKMSPMMHSLLGYKQPEAVLGLWENGDPMRDLESALKAANS
ncbi:phytanoyl-CoA dioxygenase [Cadophora sp. MPI-SDFR-AT-0126]|nr:phytanoyl-CoA dioxygenase [Leotiomycetes sp. MPI-SDFR-AT-0126]